MVKMAITLAIISVALMVFFVVYLLVINPKSDYDREIDDREQMDYLKKYSEKKKEESEKHD